MIEWNRQPFLISLTNFILFLYKKPVLNRTTLRFICTYIIYATTTDLHCICNCPMEVIKNTGAETMAQQEDDEKKLGFSQNKLDDQEKKPKKQKKWSYYFGPKFGCMRLDDGVAAAPDIDGSFNVEAKRKDHVPTHLIVMVNGIIGSAQDWRYAAKQFVKVFPEDVIVHCSECNSSMLTFDGVDVMGRRLAEEVISVIKRHPNLQKISFVAHSLGGLIARYAAACLYQQEFTMENSKENGDCILDESKESSEENPPWGKIAGLEPVNFITSATPHLGSRGHRQVPVFCGFKGVEKVASHASGLLGRTGKHLFLRDCENGKPPLLLQMSSDSGDLKFISALKSFKRRVAYANTHHDHLVGWSSSSLRRRNQLPKHRNLLKDAKYPHILHEDPSKLVNPQEVYSLDAKVARSRTREMEDAVIRGLTTLTWERVDVNFGGSIQRLLAHNTIQVKTYCINSHGADVIQHMMDNFQLL